MPGTVSKTETAITAGDVNMVMNGVDAADPPSALTPNAGPKTNGIHGSPGDNATSGNAPSPVPLVRNLDKGINPLSQLPPEIEHITLGYRPISLLIERLAQEAFNSLDDVLSDLVDIPIVAPQVNGDSNHLSSRPNGTVAGDTSSFNVRKKTRFFDWANSRRAQFIKTLVLSRWSRQADSLAKIIDLRIWLIGRQADYDEAVHSMGEMKRTLSSMKQHDPDIRTALEVLSLGKASWIPDLGYLPSDQLTCSDMLAGLRRINALLAIRLNIHEKIPTGFASFSISSGRATFRIPDECEVDLSIVDEDFSNQLYFVDLRFAFSPPQLPIPPGRIRDELEFQANAILGRDGLNGLYDHLHNQILTQKLLVLRQQAFEMAGGHWAGNIMVEPVRRALVVQYWKERPGQKSWIEIGIKRNGSRPSRHTEREQKLPGLALRWFKQGKEQHDFLIDLRPGNLSLQYILEQTIAQHMRSILAEIASSLQQSASYGIDGLRIRSTGGRFAGSRESLLVQLTSQQAIKIVIDAVSGRVSVLPSSELSARAEYEFNRSSSLSADGAGITLQLRSRATHRVIESLAVQLGWKMSLSFRPDTSTFQKLFSESTHQARYYRRDSWHQNWLLAFSTSPAGDSWRAVELTDLAPSDSSGLGRAASAYTTALKIPQSPSGTGLDSSEASLLRVEQMAIGMISQHVDTRQLASIRIPHKIQAVASTSTNHGFPSLYLRLPATIFTPSLVRSPSTMSVPWAHEVLKLEYQGLNISHSSCIFRASCRIAPSFTDLKDLASKMAGMAFHPASSALTLQLRAKVGESSIPQLLHRISGIGRLYEYVAIIKSQKLLLETFSMSSLTFTYQQSPQTLRAAVDFPANSAMQLRLSSPNPHLRIIDHLNTVLRTQGLANVLPILSVTRSLLSSLTQLEQSHPTGDIVIIARSEQSYQIRYSFLPEPTPPSKSSGAATASPTTKSGLGFDILLRRRRDAYEWHIPEQSIQCRPMSNPIPTPKPKRSAAAINAAVAASETKWRDENLKPVTRGMGNGWHGVSGGLIATLDGVSDALQRLDAVFVLASRKEETPEKSHATTGQAPLPPPQTQPPAQNSRPGKRKAEEEPGASSVIG